jgi:D-serine deaminase-like pyridoxal phosphate-dependent protein
MVISRPRPAKAIVDAGLKAVTPEFGDLTDVWRVAARGRSQ